uniref:CnidEF n=1 Tax=Anthopleura elegantissima TaxID=6110 RepID=Q2ESH9_ANTEL|nr:CnidEF [Anthopleura elegantissima]
MKTLMLSAALFLAVCVVLPQTGAGCHRVRVTRCYLVCGSTKCYKICVVSYHWVCPGKRDQIEDAQGSRKKGPEKAIIEKFSNKFSTYDKDGDNSISFDEFRTTLGDVHDRKMLRNLFNTTDKNGDNAITCDEFLKAKFDFSEKPVCR